MPRFDNFRGHFDPHARLAASVISGTFGDLKYIHDRLKDLEKWQEKRECKQRKEDIKRLKSVAKQRISFLLDEENAFILYLNAFGHVIDDDMIVSVIERIQEGLPLPKGYKKLVL